jgi:chromosome segregation ATPase
MRKRKQKEKEKTLEQERKVLRETLDIVVQESLELKGILAEVKTNINENKLQLQEKINSITDKETAVTMLTSQIDSLKQKFNEIQQTRQKLQSFVNNNISDNDVISKGSDKSLPNFSNRLRHKNINDIKNKKKKKAK